MDSKLAWAEARRIRDERVASRARRRDIIAGGGEDPEPWQPLFEAYVWAVTVSGLQSVQVGGALVPLSDESFGIAVSGIRHGYATHRLASREEVEEFLRDETRRRSEIAHAKDKEEHRTRMLVSAVPPASRKAV